MLDREYVCSAVTECPDDAGSSTGNAPGALGSKNGSVDFRAGYFKRILNTCFVEGAPVHSYVSRGGMLFLIKGGKEERQSHVIDIFTSFFPPTNTVSLFAAAIRFAVGGAHPASKSTEGLCLYASIGIYMR